jgi:transcriptional regulator with GAF, ATPase, and Fis domain
MINQTSKDHELPLVERSKLLQLTQQLSQKVHVLETLHEVGASITSLLHLDELLTKIVEASVQFTGAEEGYLLLREEQTGHVYLRAEQNLGEECARGLRWRVDDRVAGQVIKTGKPVMINYQKKRALEIKTGYMVKSLLNVAMKSRTKVIGVLGVDKKESEEVFSEDDLKILSILADYAAIAVQNATLYGVTDRHATLMGALVRAAQEISGTVALSHQMDTIWKFVDSQLSAPMFFIAHCDDFYNSLHFEVAYDMGMPTEIKDRSLSRKEDWGLTGYVVKTGEEIWWCDSKQKELALRQLGICAIQQGTP